MSQRSMQPENIHVALGITTKKRVNRRQLAKDLRERWSGDLSDNVYVALVRAASMMIGRLDCKAKHKSPVTGNRHRITDEEAGVLKFLHGVLDIVEQQPKTAGEEYDILDRAMGLDVVRVK